MGMVLFKSLKWTAIFVLGCLVGTLIGSFVAGETFVEAFNPDMYFGYIAGGLVVSTGLQMAEY